MYMHIHLCIYTKWPSASASCIHAWYWHTTTTDTAAPQPWMAFLLSSPCQESGNTKVRFGATIRRGKRVGQVARLVYLAGNTPSRALESHFRMDTHPTPRCEKSDGNAPPGQSIHAATSRSAAAAASKRCITTHIRKGALGQH